MRSIVPMRHLILLYALLSVSLLAFAGASDIARNASAYSDIDIQFQRPAYAGKSQTVYCTLSVSGGPALDLGGNYTYRAEIIADNDTGASVTPSSGGDPSGVFALNVTMPGEAPQTIKIKFNITSRDISAQKLTWTEREFEIKVVDPIMIQATVYNRGSVDASNVTAEFYADGTLLGTQTFAVTAGSQRVLTYNWTWLKISNGEHVVTVIIDDPNDIAEFSDGNNVFSKTIYVGEQGNPLGAVLSVIVGIMAVLVVLTWLQKPIRGKKS